MRPVLTRDRIVAAAVALVDEAGPDALTMRAVAQRLGAGAMSLYRHVAGREELLDLVAGSMAADMPAPELTGEWRTDLAAIARTVRAALVRRPQATVMITSRAGRSGAELAMQERVLGCLRAAGFGPLDATLANHALGNYVAGVALWEAVGLAGTTGEERAARRRAAGEAIAALPATEFPNVTWAGEALVAGSLDERFEFGLAVLLDGLEARRRSRPASAGAG